MAMSDEFLSKFKENAIALVSLYIIYIVIFGFPDNTGINDSLMMSILPVGSYLIFRELSKNKWLRDFIFKNMLIKTAKQFKMKNSKHDYYILPGDYKKEIDAIDKYVNKFASDYILSIFLIVFSLALSIAYKARVLFLHTFNFQSFSIPGWIVIVFLIMLNLIFLKNSVDELNHYMENYKEIYERQNAGTNV